MTQRHDPKFILSLRILNHFEVGLVVLRVLAARVRGCWVRGCAGGVGVRMCQRKHGWRLMFEP
jgi:hypothetical protein